VALGMGIVNCITRRWHLIRIDGHGENRLDHANDFGTAIRLA